MRCSTKQKHIQLLALGSSRSACATRRSTCAWRCWTQSRRALSQLRPPSSAALALAMSGEELDGFEQALLDDGTHDAAGIQVLSAAEVAPLGYYTRDGLGLKGVQLFA